jgi:hypothetical protein
MHKALTNEVDGNFANTTSARRVASNPFAIQDAWNGLQASRAAGRSTVFTPNIFIESHHDTA